MNFQSVSSNTEHSITEFKVTESIFIWEIRNFKSSMDLSGNALSSPTFSTGADKNYTWRIDITEKGEYLELYLPLLRDGPETNAQLILSICGQENNEKIIRDVFLRVKMYDSEKRIFPDFIKKDYLLDEKNGLLVNGTLTIKCKFCIHDRTDYLKTEINHLLVGCSVTHDMESLFESKILSDVKIVVGKEEFQAHKCILAARSRVFSAMFEHDMVEKNKNIVKIQDIDPKVMEELLRFMYCGKIKNETPVTDLFAAANKYEVEELKKICEDKLFNSLNGENIGELLVFSDHYKAEKLKKHALNFITSRKKEVNLEKFKAAVESHSPLLVDLVCESSA